jgi:hypothetical protein
MRFIDCTYMMMVVTLDILNSRYNLIENQKDRAKVLFAVSQNFSRVFRHKDLRINGEKY